MSQAPDYAPLWRWIVERERVRVRKEAGGPPPYTDDAILSTYRFCNVRREDDRGTVWVREHVRVPYADHQMLWLMLCICRIINWPDTLEELIDDEEGAWPDHDLSRPMRITEVLNARKARGEKIYTGAYMIPAPQARGADKQAYVAETMIGGLWQRRDDWPSVAHVATLEETHRWIRETTGWGNFLAYQAVVDMRYTRILENAHDVSIWAAAGPGTIRGLNRLHGRAVDAHVSQGQALEEMREIYRIAPGHVDVRMDFSDVPNVLCETDKYLRVVRGEGRPRALYVPGRGS